MPKLEEQYDFFWYRLTITETGLSSKDNNQILRGTVIGLMKQASILVGWKVEPKDGAVFPIKPYLKGVVYQDHIRQGLVHVPNLGDYVIAAWAFSYYEVADGPFSSISPKSISLECPCGIARVMCDYHKP